MSINFSLLWEVNASLQKLNIALLLICLLCLFSSFIWRLSDHILGHQTAAGIFFPPKIRMVWGMDIPFTNRINNFQYEQKKNILAALRFESKNDVYWSPNIRYINMKNKRTTNALLFFLLIWRFHLSFFNFAITCMEQKDELFS